MFFTSIKTKMTLAVFLLVVLLMSVTTITAERYFEQQFKRTVAVQQFALLDAVANQIDERVLDFLGDLDDLADSITPSLLADPHQAQRLLDSQKKRRVFFDNSLFLFSRNGKLLAATPRELNFIGKDFSSRDYFQKTVATGKIQISAPFASIQKESRSIIMFSTPVYAGGRIIAVLGGSVDLRKQHYLRSLSSLKLGQKGYLSLYDTNRTVLMHGDKSRVLKRDHPQVDNLIGQALAGFEGSRETRTVKGMPVLRSVKRLRSTDWILALSYPLSDTYAPLQTARAYFLSLSISAACLSLLIVWHIMKYLTKPLLSFTSHLEQLPVLEGVQRLVPIRCRDEIGVMAHAFNQMVLELEQNKSQLKEQKDFAENLVLNSSLPTFVINPQHKVLIWNKACEELTGVMAAEVIGTDRHWSAFYRSRHPSLADVIIDGDCNNLPLINMECEQSRLLNGGWHCEGWLDQIYGTRIFVLIDATPIYNDSGEMIAAIETIRDITGLKKAEQDLELSRDFYLTLFETFPALIWRSGTDSRCDYFNQTWLDFTGRPLEEEKGDGWAAGIHPDDASLCRSTYFDAFHARSPYQAQYRLRNHDGEYRWIIDMGRPFSDLDGNFAGYIGVCYDVTDREEAASKILKLSRVVEQSCNAVVIGAPDGTIEYVNPRTVAATGYTVEELVGQGLMMLTPAEAAGQVEQALQEVIGQGREWRGEIPGRTKSGEIFWEHVTISPIKTLEGKITHFVSTKEDITERKQFEFSLRQSEERYRQLFDNNPHPMWAYDLETLQFLAVNNVAIRHYGYSREEFLAMTIKDIRPAEDVPALIETVVHRTGALDVVWRHVKKDGNTILVQITSHPIRFSGREARVVLASDVTEKLRMEEENRTLEKQLTQSQKMEAIGTLTGGIAHDFNNILTAIVGYATLIQMEMGQDDPLQGKLAHILSASQRAANLTRSLLTYSRKQASNPACVGLNAIIARTEALLSRLIPESIEFRSLIAGQELTIMADSGQIEQVLMNLIVNARDAMPEGGQLRIATEAVTLDGDFIAAHGYGSAGSYALLTVSDSGIGMDKQTRDRIFEPFFTTKEIGKGTGLGLAMVYGIIKQHAGFITCYSELGHGTVFRIYLPLTDTQPRQDAEQDQGELPRGDETILLVEDDEALREMVGELLEDFGYTVVKAVDGEDAIKKFRKIQHLVQMVILDVIMPKLNGKEAYNVMSQMTPGLKALFMSGYTADVACDSLSESCSFVSKPIDIRELLTKVRNLLGAAA